MALAHAGLAVAMAGMIGASVWKTEVVTNLRPGETVELAGYSLLFEGVGKLQGPNYMAERASFAVTRDGEAVALMFPEKRVYDVRAMPTTEAAISHTRSEERSEGKECVMTFRSRRSPEPEKKKNKQQTKKKI